MVLNIVGPLNIYILTHLILNINLISMVHNCLNKVYIVIDGCTVQSSVTILKIQCNKPLAICNNDHTIVD